MMAPPGSEPCRQQRLPADELLQPAAASDDRAPAAGTSDGQQAPAEDAPAEKKSCRAAGGASRGEDLVAARRPAAEEMSARERLKRHRTEMAGRVRIPDMWGQERLLKDWVDCAVFDRPLAASAGLLTARDALVAEFAAARRPAVSHGSTGRPLRVQNGCS
ncbi:hypothetical protein BS78_04G151800 [Paspalum vaginatum]|nr:hypothetical protein BS78_04G151800 [Paspalum vaginatum]